MHNQSPAEHVATLYRFCAQSMQYPDASWFNDQYREKIQLLLATLGADDQSKALEKSFARNGDILEDLQVEHTRLFITGVPHVAAPPYASVYMEKTLRGPYSDKILHFYNTSGYDLKAGADLPDSIIHQLEFLSFIVRDQNSEGEIEFLSQFFLPWFPVFASRVKEEAQHPFYPIIISLIDFFTKEEEEYGI